MELLDLTLRIEKRFGVKVPYETWHRYLASRRPPDLSAGEVRDAVEQRVARTRERAVRSSSRPPDGPTPGEVPVLGYADATTDHAAPDDVWPDVQLLICQTACVARSHVRPDTWLVRDLGFG